MFYNGDPFTILNILNQIRLGFRNETNFSKTMLRKFSIGNSINNSKSKYSNTIDSNLTQIKNVKDQVTANKSKGSYINNQSIFIKDWEMNTSLNNTKFNELKNLELNSSKEKKINSKSGFIQPKTCKLNGLDHSLSPFAPMTRDLRKKFIMPKECFFN